MSRAGQIVRMPVTRENLRIVLVENDRDDLFFLERALDTAGFTHPLVHLQDGVEAMHYFSNLESRKPRCRTSF